MKRLGQYFLKNRTVIQKIIRAIGAESEDLVIEVGPGHGELTIPLARACEAAGATIMAIEKDAELAAHLEADLRALNIKNVEVRAEDALTFFKTEFAPRGKYKIVGNIPYYLTGHLLRTMGELDPVPARCVFMVQREVGERILAVPPATNRLSASIRFWADPEIVARVPKENFSPPPDVDSVVILLQRKAGEPRISPERYYRALRALFAQPRKTVLNNLAAAMRGGVSTKRDGPATKNIIASRYKSMTKDLLIEALKNENLDPNARPQDLSVRDIESLAEKLF